ncbi:hypothetical protein [Aeromicrobium sp. UC242_57]|uniref:hypothetical protein n=1 Tax=Aeromicrobium sp. UC242_57 TaxID=3374624 RepID=UPI00379A862C
MTSRTAGMTKSFMGVATALALVLLASTAAAAITVKSNRAPSSSSAATPLPAEKDGTLDTSVPDRREVLKQERLESYVSPLLESGLLESAENFGGDAFDVDANAYDMWWRGAVPKNVQKALDSFDVVKVRLHEASYSAREIEAAATKVAQYRSDQFGVVTTTLGSLERPTPVHGIEVEVEVHGTMSLAAIAEELTELAGLPVSVNQELASVPAVGKLPRHQQERA